MRFARLAAAVGSGYLLGSIPTADLVARRVAAGLDLRSAGSGNPGAANALAVLGPRPAAAVMLGDIAKGATASCLGAALAGPTAAHLAGSAAVAGHCWPATSWVAGGKSGGKGVATSVGQCLATFPAYFPIDVGVAALTASSTRWRQRAFVATAVSSVCWVLGGVVWWRRQWGNLWGPPPTAVLPLASALSAAMILQRFAAARRPHHASSHQVTDHTLADGPTEARHGALGGTSIAAPRVVRDGSATPEVRR